MPNELEEFHYLSSIFVCGLKSPRKNSYKVYNLDIFRTRKDLSVEIEATSSVEHRVVAFGRGLDVRTDVSRICGVSTYAQSITYVNKAKGISVTDLIFSDLEFDIFNKNLDALVERKIRAVALLLRAIYTNELDGILLLINDFPYISSFILKEISMG